MNNLLAHWKYSSKQWDEFVTIEKGNKKEVENDVSATETNLSNPKLNSGLKMD